jgi:ABC-type sulfate transport system permease component
VLATAMLIASALVLLVINSLQRWNRRHHGG